MGDEKMKLGADLSQYQYNLTEDLFRKLVDNGLAFVIFRSQYINSLNKLVEDFQAPRFRELCSKYSIPCGQYFYIYPGYSFDRQIQLSNTLVSKWGTNISFPDMEEYKNLSTGLPYDPNTLNTFYREYYNNLDGVKGIYTGDWFIKKYVPQAAYWLANVDNLWWAWYYKYYFKWIYFIATLGPLGMSIPMDKLPTVVSWLEQQMSATVPGTMNTHWTIWQFISNLKIKEMVNVSSYLGHFDFNVMRDEDYERVFGDAPPIPPPPAKRYQATTAVWIRSGGSLFYPKVGYLSMGEEVSIIEVVNGWANIGRGWVKESYLAPV